MTTDICLRERSSRTTSLKRSGTIGRSAIRQLLYFGVVRVRFGELDEVPDSPCDHVVGTLEEALLLLERARQHARQVLPHGGLLGDQRASSDMAVSVAGRSAGVAHGPVLT